MALIIIKVFIAAALLEIFVSVYCSLPFKEHKELHTCIPHNFNIPWYADDKMSSLVRTYILSGMINTYEVDNNM